MIVTEKSPYRQRCGRCGERPPVKIGGLWIDYCYPCWREWGLQVMKS